MSKSLYLITILIVWWCRQIQQSNCENILAVFPIPSISHQVVFRPLVRELAMRGHQVTVITTDPAFTKEEAPANLFEIDIHDISYEAWQALVIKSVKSKNDGGSVADSIQMATIFNELIELQFKGTEVQKLLNESRKFDLLITQSCLEHPLIFGHIYEVPVIQISSFGTMLFNNAAIGMPSHPFLYPTVTRKKIYNLTTWEKVTELYKYLSVQSYFAGPFVESQDAVLRRVFGPNIPSISELRKKVDMLFLNLHPIWEDNIPVPPNVIHIWGIHKRTDKELPEDLKSYLDSSTNGVIYMSFGTNTMPSLLPEKTIQAFVKAFSQLPYDILWKWDKDDLPGQTKNIKIGKWFPQSDLLKHPKVKLFITQGGLQSTEEAIEASVPLVGIPIRVDQWYNVEKYVHFKIGEKVDLETLNAEDMIKVIQSVLADDSYRQNMVRLRSVMRDEPQPALERAVWWTEYVLRHKGAGHLRSPAANLSWAEYYEIPLVSSLLIGLVIISLAILLTVRYLVKCFLQPVSKIKIN